MMEEEDRRKRYSEGMRNSGDWLDQVEGSEKASRELSLLKKFYRLKDEGGAAAKTVWEASKKITAQSVSYNEIISKGRVWLDSFALEILTSRRDMDVLRSHLGDDKARAAMSAREELRKQLLKDINMARGLKDALGSVPEAAVPEAWLKTAKSIIQELSDMLIKEEANVDPLFWQEKREKLEGLTSKDLSDENKKALENIVDALKRYESYRFKSYRFQSQDKEKLRKILKMKDSDDLPKDLTNPGINNLWRKICEIDAKKHNTLESEQLTARLCAHMYALETGARKPIVSVSSRWRDYAKSDAHVFWSKASKLKKYVNKNDLNTLAEQIARETPILLQEDILLVLKGSTPSEEIYKDKHVRSYLRDIALSMHTNKVTKGTESPGDGDIEMKKL
jgi:hypothetical protein